MAKVNNRQVAHLFAHHQAGSGSNFYSTDGARLYSYATCVAFWEGGILFYSADNMSPTTGKQLSYLRQATPREVETFASSAFSYGSRGPNAAECIRAAAQGMEQAFNTALRSRKYLDEEVSRYQAERAHILDLAKRFNIQDLPAMPEVTGDVQELAKKQKAKVAEQNKQARIKKEKEEAERRERDKEQFGAWLKGEPVLFPYSYRRSWGSDQETDYLKISVGGEKVITSQGAEAPLDHVKRALDFYDGRYRKTCPACGALVRVNYADCACGQFMMELPAAYVPYQTNGHKIHLGAFVLDSIDEQGNVKAGCHFFTAAEIARFRAQWRI